MMGRCAHPNGGVWGGDEADFTGIREGTLFPPYARGLDAGSRMCYNRNMVVAEQNPAPMEWLPKQVEFMQSTTNQLLYSGAFGAGKTRVGNEKAFLLSMKYPGNYGLVCRKVFNDMRFSTIDNFFNDVLPESMRPAPWGDSTTCRYDRTEQTYYFPNGSRIVFRGLDKPEKIASMNVGFIFIDEATEVSESDYNMLLGRLRSLRVPFRQIFMATNPSSPNHFLYRMFFQESNERRHTITASALENTFLPEDYLANLSEFRGNYKRRYVLGEWVGFEGQIYEPFDPDVHIIEPFVIPPDWPRYRTIDYGYTNPFVCQWWAVDPNSGVDSDGRPSSRLDSLKKYMYREIYYSKRVVEDHTRDILKWSRQDLDQGARYVQAYADHDAEDRATMSKHGLVTATADKRVSTGIQEVYRQLAHNQLFFFRDGRMPIGKDYSGVNQFLDYGLMEEDPTLADRSYPIRTTEEFGGYEWRARPNSIGTVNQNEREEPKKQHDHGLDAARMFVFSSSERSRNRGLDTQQEEKSSMWVGNKVASRGSGNSQFAGMRGVGFGTQASGGKLWGR